MSKKPKYDPLLGSMTFHTHDEDDLSAAVSAKLNQGRIAGVFTTALPSSNIATDKVYDFAGTNATLIGGITWYNGDSALYNGSAWTRIPYQSLENYYTKYQVDSSQSTLRRENLNAAIVVPINESSGEGGLNPESYPIVAPVATEMGIGLNQIDTPLGLLYAHRIYCTSANTNGIVWKQINGAKLSEATNKASFGFWFNYTQLAAIMVAAGNVAPLIEFSGSPNITFPYAAFIEVTGHANSIGFSDFDYKAKILDSVIIKGNEWRYLNIVIYNVQIYNTYSAAPYYRTFQIKFNTTIRAAMIANSALVLDIANITFISNIDTYLESLLYYKDFSYTINGLSALNSRLALEESKSATLISDLDIAEATIVINTANILKNTESITNIIEGSSLVNVFNKVGTLTPGAPFANLAEVTTNGGNPKVENLTEIAESLNSPFKTKLGYVTKLTNTVAVNQTCGIITGNIFSQTPTAMGFSFWTRDADWATFSPNMYIGFQLLCFTDGAFKYCPVNFDMSAVLVGTIVTSSAFGGLLTGSLKVYKYTTISGWSQICIEMTNLVWSLTSGKTWAIKISFDSQNSKWVNKSFYIANPQMTFGAVCSLGVNVLPDVGGYTKPSPSSIPFVQTEIDLLVTKDSLLQTQIDNVTNNVNGAKSLTVTYLDQRPSVANVKVSIKSILSANYLVTNSMVWSGGIYNKDGNPAINFGGTVVTKRDTLVETVVNYEGDSISATNMQDGYFGANHGNSQYRYVTVNAHGKTFADIASKWSSGGKNYYIVAIVDANTLGILSENQGTFDLWAFSPFPNTGTLTHVSGAVNTSNIIVSASVMHQLYPSEVVIKQAVYLDGVELITGGTYYGEILEVVDVWDALNPAGALNALIANKPVNGYTLNPLMNSFADVKHVLRYSNTYRFTKGGLCMTIMDWIPLAPISFNQFFPMHTKLMAAFTGGKIYYYLPKALPCPDNIGTIYDYRTVQEFIACSGSINYTSAFWENPLLPPDRAIEFVGDATTPQIIGLHHGYLFDKGIGGVTRKDYLDNAWWIYESRASYNAAMDGKIGPQDIGAHYSFAAFRKYEDVTIHPVGVISVSQFDFDGNHYIYADFSAAGIYEINVDTKSLGRFLEVFEKSTNVSVLGGLSSGKLLIKVNAATTMYGYAVMKCIL